MTTTMQQSIPPLTDELKRRIRRDLKTSVSGDTGREKGSPIKSLIAYGGIDNAWRLAWRQRHISLCSFEPGMRVLIHIARELDHDLSHGVAYSTQAKCADRDTFLTR